MRFDHLMKKAEKSHQLFVKHLNSLARTVRYARRAAYMFARQVMEIDEKFHNEFLDYVMVHKLDIDAWMDEKFAPIEQLYNQNRRILFANIRNGMTVGEYVKHGDLWTIHKERIHPVRSNVDIDAPLSGPEASMKERFAELTTRYEIVISENRELRRKIAIVCGQLELAERKAANLTKVFTNKKAQ